MIKDKHSKTFFSQKLKNVILIFIFFLLMEKVNNSLPPEVEIDTPAKFTLLSWQLGKEINSTRTVKMPFKRSLKRKNLQGNQSLKTKKREIRKMHSTSR